MRLLITTQAVDLDDPILGFFHFWIAAFASRFEAVEVICLYEGRHSLPPNVHVSSLGKEQARASSIVYAAQYLSLIWRLRRSYDAVFVHMNQEYVLLGGLLWRLSRKPVYLWRNHYAGSFLTDLASIFCTKIFCTSTHSYTARYKKTVLMPVGVDTGIFHPVAGVERTARSILSLGRIAPSKRLEVLIDALKELDRRGEAFTCDIYGAPLPHDEAYFAQLKELVRAGGLGDRVTFGGSVRNSDTPAIYSAHSVFVNTSQSGMFDKTLFEAAACGCAVVAASEDFSRLAGTEHRFSATSSAQLADRLLEQFNTSPETLRGLADAQSLDALVVALEKEIL